MTKEGQRKITLTNHIVLLLFSLNKDAQKSYTSNCRKNTEKLLENI